MLWENNIRIVDEKMRYKTLKDYNYWIELSWLAIGIAGFCIGMLLGKGGYI